MRGCRGRRWTGKKRTRTRSVVAEGLYIASAATRQASENTILVHILADGEDFDAERYIPEARATLETLAAEAEADAARTERERKRARTRHSDSDGTHDYRSRDGAKPAAPREAVAARRRRTARTRG